SLFSWNRWRRGHSIRARHYCDLQWRGLHLSITDLQPCVERNAASRRTARGSLALFLVSYDPGTGLEGTGGSAGTGALETIANGFIRRDSLSPLPLFDPAADRPALYTVTLLDRVGRAGCMAGRVYPVRHPYAGGFCGAWI